MVEYGDTALVVIGWDDGYYHYPEDLLKAIDATAQALVVPMAPVADPTRQKLAAFDALYEWDCTDSVDGNGGST